jgi:hypothetical protein
MTTQNTLDIKDITAILKDIYCKTFNYFPIIFKKS